MMDRSMQKELIESLRGLAGLFQQIDWQDQEQVQIVEDILATVDQSCKQSLSTEHYAFYEDTLRTLKQIIETTDWLHLRAEEREECCQLCQDVSLGLIKVLANEKEIKKEIVFLPYKASMWDSLESVWQAAYDDKEHCNTYVVPIPYCDRNPDMTAAAWHCEADMFPDYVPVLDWHDYTHEKLKEMHPDVIFIHNPYDNYNAVTSVDMQYYSRNLKYCTDKLVYIPYFVMGDTIAPHFCQTQGVINADYVIVQNENIKEQYERYYPGGNCPEGKILALGSPKFDKVINSKKEDFELPESWQRIISGKKVILYNTSLTAALENTDKLCAKLRSVLNTFKGREDVAIWWRPHPLMQATLKSMRPQVAVEYEQIVEQYREEGWGIYDDSPELERAIICSDAYYGDQSSVVWLYQATGKKILLQDIADNPYAPYWFYDFVEIQDRRQLVIKPPEVGSLFVLDAVTGKVIEEIQLLSNRNYVGGIGQWSHCVIQQIGNQIVICPYKAKEWYRYQINTKKLEIIYSGAKKDLFLISGSIEYCGCAYFWNHKFQLWKYDSQQETVEMVGEWLQNIDVIDSACIMNGNLYVLLGSKYQVLAIDLDEYTAQIITVGMENANYTNISTDGEHLLLLKDGAEFDILDISTNKKSNCRLLSESNIGMVPYFVDFICTKKQNVLLFPSCECPQATKVLSASLKTGKIQEIASYSPGYGIVRYVREDCIAAIDMCNNNVDFYDGNGKIIHRCQVDIGRELKNRWYKDWGINERIIASEKCNFSLDVLVEDVKMFKQKNNQLLDFVGDKIYQWAKVK